MLQFGKKVSYRPVLVSLLIGLIVGSLVGAFFQTSIGGFLVTAVIFLTIFLGHYLVTLPNTFAYWEVDKDVIKYSNMEKKTHRLAMMLLPTTMNNLTTIDMHDLKTIILHGSYDDPKEMPFSMFYNLYLVAFSASISMNKNPMYVTLITREGHEINLNLSRDYIYDPETTFKKIDELVEILNHTPIKVINQIQNNHSHHLNLKTN